MFWARDIRLNSIQSWPILSSFDLFHGADLTCFHLSFHNKAPLTGHLSKSKLTQKLILGFRRADLGWISCVSLANFWIIARKFLSEFVRKQKSANFRPFSPGLHTQNCRYSSPISHLWTKTSKVLMTIFCLRGRSQLNSGKKKARKHKSFWPVTPPVTGGSPNREARGQRFMCYPRNPRNINLFVRIPDREDRWPGWRDRVLCEKVLYVPFLLPINRHF